VFFHVGYFPDSVPESVKGQSFAFVHLDADLFEPTMAGLSFFYPRLSIGGLIVVHDFNAWAGARKAVDEFCADKISIPMPDKNGSVVILKTGASERLCPGLLEFREIAVHGRGTQYPERPYGALA